jgi:hypothetical protein
MFLGWRVCRCKKQLQREKVQLNCGHHDGLPGADDSGRQSVADGAQPHVPVGQQLSHALLEIRPKKFDNNSPAHNHTTFEFTTFSAILN